MTFIILLSVKTFFLFAQPHGAWPRSRLPSYGAEAEHKRSRLLVAAMLDGPLDPIVPACCFFLFRIIGSSAKIFFLRAYAAALRILSVVLPLAASRQLRGSKKWLRGCASRVCHARICFHEKKVFLARARG